MMNLSVNLTLTLSALMAAAVLVYVAWPLWRSRYAAGAGSEDNDRVRERRQRLATDRDLYFGQVRDLKVDHSTGKIGDDEYERSLEQLIQRLAPIVRETLRLDRGEERIREHIEDRVAAQRGMAARAVRTADSESATRDPAEALTCADCGTSNPAGHRFCGHCGKPLGKRL